MKIALCQINPTVGKFDFNIEKISQYYQEAIERKADLVVFPELIVSGYPPQDLLLVEGFVDRNIRCVESLAKQTTIPMILGFIRKEGSGLFNSAALCYNGNIINTADKVLLPTYDVFDEDRYFQPGKDPQVWTIITNGETVKIGIQICEDLWDHGYHCKVSEIQQKLGAEFIINISASPFHEGRLPERQHLIEEKVAITGIPFVYCNMVGAQDELIFDGESLVYNSSGECMAQGKVFEEDIIVVDLNNKQQNFKPIQRSREEKLYSGLCLGVKDYFQKTGHTDALIGLSGGIDSALVTCIAVDALGKEHVHTLALPSKLSSDHSISDARVLTDNLGIKIDVLKIHDIVEQFEDSLMPYFQNTKKGVAEENIQARVRGNLLMALSNKFGWLVLSTGNKTELALGYCTLYGDMSGGLSVISDLSKTDVYKLSYQVNKAAGKNIIPISILEKQPSAELSEDQVDPFDYEIVSPLVDSIIEDQKSPNSLISDGYDEQMVWDIYRRIRNNEFKRRQAAPGLRVSPKAFGSGRRIPIVNHYDGK
ncbi:MAG: NAD+ synthase [Candidatus Neomarinimicrobiota bacterium]